MIAWNPAPEPTPTAPRITVDPERIPTHYMADVVRHMRDGAGIDRAMLLAGIDADDALTAWRQS